MTKPPDPRGVPKSHGRKPPAPKPHRSNGSMCRLGKIIGTVILVYLAASLASIAWGIS